MNQIKHLLVKFGLWLANKHSIIYKSPAGFTVRNLPLSLLGAQQMNAHFCEKCRVIAQRQNNLHKKEVANRRYQAMKLNEDLWSRIRALQQRSN